MEGSLSPSAQAGLVRLGARLPFAEAAAELAYCWRVPVRTSTARRQTEAAGAAYDAVQTAAVGRLAHAVADATPAGPPDQCRSADGAMVPLVGGAWAEVKTLAVGTLVPGQPPATPDLALSPAWPTPRPSPAWRPSRRIGVACRRRARWSR